MLKHKHTKGGLYMNKKSKFVSVVRKTIIALTAIVMIICFIRDFTDITNDKIDQGFTCVYYLFFIFPILLEEIVLFRSVHRIFNADFRGFLKICCIVSASLVFCALVLQILVFARVITADMLPERPGAESSHLLGILFLTEWPVIIVSFILGSFRKKVLN